MADGGAHPKKSSGSGSSFVKGATLHFDDGGGKVVPAKRKAATAASIDGGGRTTRQQQPTQSAATQAQAHHAGIGWSLLRKAGWAPGSGLGRDGTGNVQPLAPRVQRSTRGLGHADERGQVLVGGQVRRAADAAAVAATAAATAAAAAAGASGDGDKGALQGGGRAWAGPLTLQQDARSQQRRRRRQQQGRGGGEGNDDGDVAPEVLTAAQRQAAEDARGKAIARALRAEFAAPASAEAGDTNPLLSRRRTRLTATNPLLGSDSEGDGFG